MSGGAFVLSNLGGDFVRRGFCPGGIMSGGDYVRGDNVLDSVSRTRRFPERRFQDYAFFRHHFCRAMFCISVGYPVASSLSVHLSVCHVRVFCRNEQTYPTIFHHPVAIILGFPYQTLWQYSGWNHPSPFNAAVECK